MRRRGIGIVVWLISCAAWGQMPDLQREARLRAEIEPALVQGDAVDLEVPGAPARVLGIWTDAGSAPRRGAVILVHGKGVHPDWGLIATLRQALPEQGYATLSVQMPVLAAERPAEDYPPLFPEAARRLDAAAAWLKTKGVAEYHVIGHSVGARMVDDWLARRDRSLPLPRSWVAVGMMGAMQSDGAVPLLDVAGENDFPAVLEAAPQRRKKMQTDCYRAEQVAGADHYFAGGTDRRLAERIVRHLQSMPDRAEARCRMAGPAKKSK